MSMHEHGIEPIVRLARQAERRLRLSRMLDVEARAFCVALIACVVVLALRKTGTLGEGAARVLLALFALMSGLAGVAAWVWRLPENAGARALDRFHGLNDRLASALAFATIKPRTPFMDAAIEDALIAATSVRPRQAVQIRVPKSLPSAIGLGCLVVLVGSFEVRRHERAVMSPSIVPLEMSSDDLDDVKASVKELEERATNDDTKASIDEFNKLLQDMANRRLDRTEAFRRMEGLEQRLLTGREADKAALEAELAKMGDELRKSELTKVAGSAMAAARLDEAREALQALAKKLRQKDPAVVDKAKLDQLRESLKQAAQDAEKRREAIERRRDELADELLKSKSRQGDAGADEEDSLLAQKKRELERLERDVNQQSNASHQLDRLDRELEQAAEDLMHDMGVSADDLDRGAEDLDRMNQEQMTDQQKEELRKKLEELKELVRQQGQGGGQMVRLRRFSKAAHGQGNPGKGGQKGDGQKAGGDDDSSGEGSGQESSGADQQGNGSSGGSQAGAGGETWILGPNGEKMMILSRSQGSGGAAQSGDGEQHGDGQSGGGGHSWGTGHDPRLQGNATNPAMTAQDTQVEGADGKGASRSQVILGAAERGFVSGGYKKVYTEYHEVAEQALAKDEIPGGYLFYVKRYFQLIRPR